MDKCPYKCRRPLWALETWAWSPHPQNPAQCCLFCDMFNSQNQIMPLFSYHYSLCRLLLSHSLAWFFLFLILSFVYMCPFLLCELFKGENYILISLETSPMSGTYQILSKCWTQYLVKHGGLRSHNGNYSDCRDSLTSNRIQELPMEFHSHAII